MRGELARLEVPRLQIGLQCLDTCLKIESASGVLVNCSATWSLCFPQNILGCAAGGFRWTCRAGIVRRIPKKATSYQTRSSSRLFTIRVDPSLKDRSAAPCPPNLAAKPLLLDKATIIFTGQTHSRDIPKPYSEHPHLPCIITPDPVSLRGTPSKKFRSIAPTPDRNSKSTDCTGYDVRHVSRR